MGSGRVRIGYFFDHPEGFPWDVLGLSRPYTGALHSYLIDAAMIFCSGAERALLQQRPTISELRRWAKAHPDSIFTSIVKACDDNQPTCRTSLARSVVSWLEYQPKFTKFMSERLNQLWRAGSISIPGEAHD